jgi:transcriptional regulator with XRE-family HTH domain
VRRHYDGQALREMRERAGMSRTLLAACVERTEGSIRKYEDGDRIPSGPTLGRLADVLDVTVDAFFTGQESSDAA